jgi:hypothetical protein
MAKGLPLRFALYLCALALAAWACGTGPVATPEPSTAVVTTAPPSPTIPPQPSATPAPPPVLVTVGPTEVVYDWTKDRCENLDIPDLPARAFRDGAGNVNLIAAHITNRRAVGPDLNSVKHQCQPVMSSTHDADPSKFDDNEWIASTYTEDGSTIYALIHNEFHGWEHGICSSSDNFACWYNAITLAVSRDGGTSYQHAAEPPAHLVASLPHVYEDSVGPYGVMEPGNIIKKDGYYYVFVKIDEYKSDEQRVCLLRTKDLSDASSWRAWDGTDFTVAMNDPYTHEGDPESMHHCAGMDPNLGLLYASVTFNTYVNRYVMFGLSTDNFSSSREIWGVMYAFSDDLIHWDLRTLLFEAPLPWSNPTRNPHVYLYPSLLDPSSASRNFETSGQTAYLYLTRFNGGDPLDRDLIRIPVEFFANEAEAKAAAVPFVP